MKTLLRFAHCLLLMAVIAPATMHDAQDAPDVDPVPVAPSDSSVRPFSEKEVSAAQKALEKLTPEQRAVLNHLRYLMHPQYEAELMAGRAFAPCPLLPFEQPGAEFESLDALRLWVVLASGMPATDSAGAWLRLFLATPVPSGAAGLAELGLHMAVCAHAVRRGGLGLSEELTERAEEVLKASEKARRITADNSPLIEGKRIDPQWFANHLWRGLIARFALEMELNINERVWESCLRNLLGARDKDDGWKSTAGSSSEPEDLDANLFAMAALSLAVTAPEGVLGKGILRSINKGIEASPSVLKRLEEDFASSARVGTRLAMIHSFAPELAPEGTGAKAWRESASRRSLDGQDSSGAVMDGGFAARSLGFSGGRRSMRVTETAFAGIALSGGLLGGASPLAEMDLAAIGRAMHAWTVIHASKLPEGAPRTYAGFGQGHELPEPGTIERFMHDSIDYLLDLQHKDGGWGSAWAAKGQSGTPDVGTTAFVTMALLRTGNGPLTGEHKDAVMEATEYVLEVVEQAEEDGPRITSASSTQLQRKLGGIVDTAVVTQFLSRVLHQTESDRRLYMRVEDALDKCVRKIEESQDEDGGWITSGWAPILQSAMFNQALELAQVAGRDVDADVLARSRAYLAGDVEVETGKTAASDKPKRSVSAGVAFYAGSSALRATAGEAAQVSIAMERAKKNGTLKSSADVSEKNLRKIGYSNEQAESLYLAHLRHEAMLEKLDDDKYLKGFGNNGGEEFISYMMSSESIVITGGETWEKWNGKMHEMFEKLQNADGSWSGYHCISSPVLCTAAVFLCLTADRDVHVLLDPTPGESRKGADDDKSEDKDGPVTGK